MPIDAVQKLIESVLTQQQQHNHEKTSSDNNNNKQQAYTILIQHIQSFQLRYQTTISLSGDELAIYKRANLLTPQDIAYIDYNAGYAWLDYIINTILLKHNNSTIIYIETLCKNNNNNNKRDDNPRIIYFDCCTENDGGPYGWDNDDDDDDDDTTSTGLLNNLSKLLERIQQIICSQQRNITGKITVIINSIQPILIRHGLDCTIQFINELKDSCYNIDLLIIPVCMEMLTKNQHTILQDINIITNATLVLQNQYAQLIRQGIRETSNIIREPNITYQIITDTLTGQKRLKILSDNKNEQDKSERDAIAEDNDPMSSLITTTEMGKVTTSLSSHDDQNNKRPSKNKKIQLVVNEGQRSSSSNNEIITNTNNNNNNTAPRIFLQDDDPEFNDYDEEDPDDDLDI